MITEQEEPSLPPTDIRVHSKSTSTIKLSWRAPLKNSWNGQLTGYLVAFKMLKENEMSNIDIQSLSSNEQTFALNTVKFNSQQSDDYYQEYTLTNLQKETLYCIMIRALNKVGHGPYSQPIIVTTSNNDPPLAPMPWIDTIQKNSMVIKWTQNGNKDDLTHYILYYKDNKTVWLETTFSAKEYKNSFTLTGLNEGTFYEIYMKASSHHGMSEPSKIVRQITQSSSKDTGGSLRSLQDSASRMFSQYANIPPYLRSYVVIPVSIAFVLIVMVISAAIGYIKYEEKKTALIQASLGMMASSPSKNFQYINSSVNSPTANIQTNHLFNLSNQSNTQTLNSSTVSEEGYHSLKYTDFDKSNKPLLASRPFISNNQQATTSNQQPNLWIQRQSPIIEESDGLSDPYETLKKYQTSDDKSTPIKNSSQLPPPLPSGRPASINLLTSAINISKQLERNNLLDLTINTATGTNIIANTSSSSNNSSSFNPQLNSSTINSNSTYSQDLNDRKNQIFADIHHRDDSDGYDFFSPHNL